MDINNEESINFAASRLGIEPRKLHEERKCVIFEYISKRDVLVGLPTGFGKSFIFQAAPLVIDFITKPRPSTKPVDNNGE